MKSKRIFSSILVVSIILSVLLYTVIPVSAVSFTYNPTSSYKTSEYYQNALDIVLTGDYAVDLIQLAFSQQWYHESSSSSDYSGTSTGSGNYTEYGHWYGTEVSNPANSALFNASWCAMFISWCARQAEIPTSVISNGTYAAPKAGGFPSVSFTSSDNPEIGDLVFFCWAGDNSIWDHVEIVYTYDDNYIYSIGGNHDNCVRWRQTARNSSTIRGYGKYSDHGSFDTDVVIKDSSIRNAGGSNSRIPITVNNTWSISDIITKLNTFPNLYYKFYDAAGKWLYTYNCLDDYFLDSSDNKFYSVSDSLNQGSFIELCDQLGNVYVTLSVNVSAETTDDIIIIYPEEGETYPLEDMRVQWSECTEASYYTYSLRDITTNEAMFENIETTRTYGDIDASDFQAGHHYRVAVMARDTNDDVIVWSQNVFSIADAIPVTGVQLNKSTYTMEVGDRYTLIETVLPTNATNQDVTWKSSKTSVATVSASGRVTAKAAGTATITVTTDDGEYTAKCKITVTEPNIPVTGVALDKTYLELNIGEKYWLSEIITPEDATNQEVSWESSDPNVATVNDSGYVTAIAEGSTIITVTTNDGGYTAECYVSVPIVDITITHVTGISLNYTSYENLGIGQSFALIPTVQPSDATNKVVHWSSDNSSVATVDENGYVKGISKGITTITATTEDRGYTATCTVYVGQTQAISVSGVKLSQSQHSLSIGDTMTLTATVFPTNADDPSVTWSSSAPNIASVNNGVVTAKAVGTAIITVTTNDGGFTDRCTIYVEDPSSDPIVTIETIADTSVVCTGRTFTYSVYLSGTYEGFAFYIPVSENMTVTDVSSGAYVGKSVVNVNKMTDGRWLVSILPGCNQVDSEKTLVTTITVSVSEDHPTGTETLALEDVAISDDMGDPVRKIKSAYDTITITDSIPGDINGDGVFNYFDVSKLYACFCGKTTIDNGSIKDINGDGTFDYFDVAKLYAVYRGDAVMP